MQAFELNYILVSILTYDCVVAPHPRPSSLCPLFCSLSSRSDEYGDGDRLGGDGDLSAGDGNLSDCGGGDRLRHMGGNRRARKSKVRI